MGKFSGQSLTTIKNIVEIGCIVFEMQLQETLHRETVKPRIETKFDPLWTKRIKQSQKLQSEKQFFSSKNWAACFRYLMVVSEVKTNPFIGVLKESACAKELPFFQIVVSFTFLTNKWNINISIKKKIDIGYM